MIFLCFSAVFFWFGGYLMTARFMSTDVYSSDDLKKIIAPPKWLYFLCGAPVHKEYPKGTMRVDAFRTQIAGILMGIFLVWSFISKASSSANVIGFALSMLFTFMFTSYVSKRYVSRNQFVKRKRRN